MVAKPTGDQTAGRRDGVCYVGEGCPTTDLLDIARVPRGLPRIAGTVARADYKAPPAVEVPRLRQRFRRDVFVQMFEMKQSYSFREFDREEHIGAVRDLLSRKGISEL